MNSTTDDIGAVSETSFKLETIVSLTIFALGFPVNIAALISHIRSLTCELSRQQRLVQTLGLQMTLINLLILVFSCLWRALWLYWFVWPWGDVLCRIFSFGVALGRQLWSNMVAAISLDLLLCLRDPITSYTRTGHRTRSIIVVVWSLAVLLAAPTLIVRGTVVFPGSQDEQCYSVFYDNRDLSIFIECYFLTTSFYLPLVIICGSNIFSIVTYLHNRRIRRDMLHQNNAASVLCEPGGGQPKTLILSPVDTRNQTPRPAVPAATLVLYPCTSQTASGNTRLLKTVLRSEKRVARKRLPNSLIVTSVAIVLTYVLTWSPLQVISVWNLLCNKSDLCTDDGVLASWEWLVVLTFTCTLTNPVVFRFLRQSDSCHSSAMSCSRKLFETFKCSRCLMIKSSNTNKVVHKLTATIPEISSLHQSSPYPNRLRGLTVSSALLGCERLCKQYGPGSADTTLQKDCVFCAPKRENAHYAD